MKNLDCYNLHELNSNEIYSIEGGRGFWEDAAYYAFATLKTIYVFGKTAAEYQASLPANLKK
jgi:hypothetical protein